MDIPRLNGLIKALDEGKSVFTTFSPGDPSSAQGVSTSPYDGVVFELEHGIYDITQLKHALQYLLNRRQILDGGTLMPAVTPIVRIPPNSGESNWIAKQVLDIGAYGIVWPHIDTVDDAHRAVEAMRYPKPEGHPRREPYGLRGDQPAAAATYWGITGQEYYARADLWPLAPDGELLCVLMIESVRAIKNLPKILEEVPGIGVVLTGEGDLCQDLGHPRQYDHPDAVVAINEILEICKAHNIPNGHPHVDANNVEKVLNAGYRWLMAAPERSLTALTKGRALAGR
ncbi:MAG: 5-keto-4-deoxy-D-glucarate aldolase [Nitrospira sp.]|nr:5-keto-4-deoxy-D-glucarate aldolase [Nitrospira sp.]